MKFNLMIEPTNRCQLRCPTCYSHQDNRQKHDIKLEDFCNIIDRNHGVIKNLSLYNYGEPFLNKDICKMVLYAKSHGIPLVKIATNGMNLNKVLAKKIVLSGLDYLSVSLDGASATTYRKFRKKGNFFQILKNIKNLVDWRNKLCSSLKIEIQFIIMKHNEHEIGAIKQLAKNLHVDILRLKTVLIKNKIWNYLLPKTLKYNRYARQINQKTCQKPLKELVINSDGAVLPCCYIVGKDILKYYIGNIFTASLVQISNANPYKVFIKTVTTNKSKLKSCLNCNEGNNNLNYKIIKLKNIS